MDQCSIAGIQATLQRPQLLHLCNSYNNNNKNNNNQPI